MKRKYLIFSALGIISIPFWMWGAWMLTPKKKMVLAIVDKTEYAQEGRQHMALTWVLNNERYSKTHQKLYEASRDYFGFYRSEKSKFKIKGLERFSSSQLDKLSSDCDVAYYVDTYGVYNNNLAGETNSTDKDAEMIYGGMSEQDITFLKKVKSRKKLVISEYNTLQYPTKPNIRKQFENEFGFRWSGWIGRYFDSLDPSANKDLPQWLVNNYKVKNSGKWPFTGQGLAFVSNLGEVVILEDLVHLNNPIPYIQLVESAQQTFNLPQNVKFPFWFDVIIPDTSINKNIAIFNINFTEKGREKLSRHQIPLSIPAVIQHVGNDYQFYYFSGSFCSTNTLSESSSHYKWISVFKSFLYNEDDTLESTSFFWNFYRPFMATVLDNYYKQISIKPKK